MKKWQLLVLVALCCAAAGCSTQYFKNGDAVAAFLRQHEGEYESLAVRCAAKPVDFRFTVFEDKSFEWNGWHVRKREDKFEVATGSNDSRIVPDRDAAARMIGTTLDELIRWTEDATRLHVYSVGHEGNEVEIWLEGSAEHVYGVKYAITQQAYREMVAMSSPGAYKGNYLEYRHLYGRWFFFDRRN